MGACISSRKKKVVSIPQKKVKLTSQVSHLRSTKLEGHRKLSLGKSLSFKKIAVDSILKPSQINHVDETIGEIAAKKCLFTQTKEEIDEKLILEDFRAKFPEFTNFSLISRKGNSIVAECSVVSPDAKLIIKRKFFEKIEHFSDYILHVQRISKYRIPGIEKILASRLDKNEAFGFSMDIAKLNAGENLIEFAKRKKSKNYHALVLDIIKKVSVVLNQLHRNDVAFKTLKPSSIVIEEKAEAELRVVLTIGGTHMDEKEEGFMDFYVKKEEDYKSYDVILLGFILATLISESIQMEDLYMARSNQDIAKLIEGKNDIPKSLADFLRKIIDLENKRLYSNSMQLISELESLIIKGEKDQFQSDALSDFFQAKAPKPQLGGGILSFPHKNKIFCHLPSKKLTFMVRVFLGSRKWKLRSPKIVYSQTHKSFLALVHPKKTQVGKVPFDPAQAQPSGAKIVEVKSQIEFFHEFQTPQSPHSEILLATNDSVILVSEEIREFNGVGEKVLAKYPFSGQYHYSFVDSFGSTLFILRESIDYFKNGIHMFRKDLKSDGDLIEIKLKFGVRNEMMLREFQMISCEINPVSFCLEICEHVFLVDAGQTLLVLDVEKGVFFSFSSLFQISNHDYARRAKPHAFPHKFELRNIPFELNLSVGSYYFEEGILEFFCKMEAELLLCKFVVFASQACLSLLNCQDLSQGKDFMIVKPKERRLDWNLLERYQNPETQPQSVVPVLKKIREYEILHALQNETPDGAKVIEYKARKGLQKFGLWAFEIAEIRDFEKIFERFLFVLQNSYVLETYELFLAEEGGQMMAVVVSEHFERTLMEEFLKRKKKGKYYLAKYIAFLAKCIFKGLAYLKSMGVTHGNLDLSNIVITDKGFVKIKGWYYERRPSFQDDLLDFGLILLDLAKLELNYEFNEMAVESSKEFLNINYPGLYNFLRFILSTVPQNSPSLMNDVTGHLGNLYYSLMYKDMDYAKLISEKERLFWVNYGRNQLLTCEIATQTLMTLKVVLDDQPYVFSTFNSFAYDLGQTLYISGNKRLPNAKSQDFFVLRVTGAETESLAPLPVLPFNILKPTMLYSPSQERVFLFGGYLLAETQLKSLSNSVFSYHVKTKTWNKHTRLPISMVSATAIENKKGIYLFGGVSEEFDLTGQELSFLFFDLSKDKWDFLVNFSTRSPFENSRLLQPSLVSLGSEEVFLFLNQSQGYVEVTMLELRMGGLNVKFRKEREMKKKASRELQNELSLGFNAGIVYKIEEGSKNLLIWDLRNFASTKMKVLEEKDNDEDEDFKEFEKKALNSSI